MEVLKSTIYFFLALFCLGGSLALGIGLGYFANLVEKTEIPSEDEIIRAINDIELVSHVNYSNGEQIAELRSDLIRTRVNKEDVSPLIKQALIATEDEYFNKHEGIVPKALIRAMVSDITGLGGKSGGSTITQQLVKQQLLTDEVSFHRKANEVLLALRVEKFQTKEEILTAYLNVSPFGRNNKGQNIAGVEEAARGIFGKHSNDVTLPQAAFIAGLPQSPIIYSPYTNTGELKEDLSEGLARKDTVLSNMYREKYIDKKTYEEAKNYDLTADFLPREEINQPDNGYLYYYVETQAIEALMAKHYQKDQVEKEKVFSQDVLYEKYYQMAERDLRRNGYTVETTIDKNIYQAMNNAVMNNAGLLEDWSGDTIQLGSILMENQTGKILGFVGGRDYATNQNNHAFQTKRSPGSTMKPIVAYAPAIDKGLIGSESQLADFKRKYGSENTNLSNYGGTSSESFISVRKAIKDSGNISVVNLYEKLLESVNPAEYFNKMNIDISSSVTNLSLPLGTTDLSVYQQINVYQTLANKGAYLEGYVISKITDSNGDIVYEHKPNPVQVFQPATASIMADLMRDVLISGTGTTAKSSLYNYGAALGNADWVGKTGTSEEDKDFWFTASTPGVTLSTWIGKSYGKQMPQSFGQNNMRVWAAIAGAAYQINPDIFQTSKRFELDPSVHVAKVSNITGTKMGVAYINGIQYYTPGKEVNSYFVPSSGPLDPTFRFGIGGTDAQYQNYWNKNAKVDKKEDKKTTNNNSRNQNDADEEEDDEDEDEE